MGDRSGKHAEGPAGRPRGGGLARVGGLTRAGGLALASVLALAACGGTGEAGEPGQREVPGTAGTEAGSAEVAGGEIAPERPVILITGSTGGLGREVALEMASRGAHVIVHGRSEERGREVVEAIAAEGVGSAEFHAADLASLAEVRALARAVRDRHPRIHILVNNAGIWLEPEAGRVLSEDGHELHFQVNYLSHVLLTRELLPLVRAAGTEDRPARILHVSSVAQRPIDFDDVMMERDYSDGRGYAQSKLAQIFHTFDLAEELEGDPVLALALHPATMMDTGMVLSRGAQARTSVDEGREALVHLMTAEGLESGQYFNGTTPARANDQAYDPEARERLRTLTLQWIGAP
jgi:NAD(P)-dependent dehydrogenase (short-subunit alcohol dehydrogenase family)